MRIFLPILAVFGVLLASAIAADVPVYPRSDIKFQLYTRQNLNVPQQLEIGNFAKISNSTFSPLRPTRFEIHGWRYNGHSPSIKDRLLKKGDFNVIFVDWTTIANQQLDYAAVMAQVPFVGETVAKFIQFLVFNTGAIPLNMVLIGEKLAAHIAGYAGQKLGPLKPGGIIGLDGAGQIYDELPGNLRLTRDDAAFVVLLHTNAGGRGSEIVTGHMDVYFYGGRVQPGCDATDDNCNHERAYQYMAHLITSKKGITGYPCGSHDLADLEECRRTGRAVRNIRVEPLNPFIQGVFYGEAEDYPSSSA